MVGTRTPVEDLCRVSGEVAAELTRNFYRRGGNVHIFDSGMHAWFAVHQVDGAPRITSGTKKSRDGVTINGNLADAVESALDSQQTVAIVLGSAEFYGSAANDHDSVRAFLGKQGALAMLNGKPIYILDNTPDRYIDILII